MRNQRLHCDTPGEGQQEPTHIYICFLTTAELIYKFMRKSQNVIRLTGTKSNLAEMICNGDPYHQPYSASPALLVISLFPHVVSVDPNLNPTVGGGKS